ncbi:hypothetical protein ACP70R_023457 [Stipagrostis hirtigluma subsp. patula]
MAENGSQEPSMERRHDKPQKEPSTEYRLKKYLLLLATLVATVTYAAGLNPPGGSWLEDSSEGEVAGDSILRETNYMRYIIFYYFNAISFGASLFVCLLLLLVRGNGQGSRAALYAIRTVMVIDLLGLMGAYAVGGSHDTFTTICASVLVACTFAYTAVAFVRRCLSELKQETNWRDLEILMVLAIFAATNAYVAGLNPPGGFWRSTQEGHHTAGDPVLLAPHPHRYKAFFFCNTIAFVASLLAIILILGHGRLTGVLYGSTITALLGLGGAYAGGSCRDKKHTAYIVGLVVPVFACISIQMAPSSCCPDIQAAIIQGCQRLNDWLNKHIMPVKRDRTETDDELDKRREVIQLLAILAATIAYQAGIDPPGGVWSDNGEGHKVGDPILLTTHPGRYKIFFYCNSAAFVASLVIMVMLQSQRLVRRYALDAAIILDMFGLIGAYAAGSCRDTMTSIYTAALAAVVLVYVVIHIVIFTLDPSKKKDEDKLKKNREWLLLLAVLAATLTYQAGLTPPGGFWEDNDKFGHRAGFPVIQAKYPRRYKAFFYCNAASFMASVALIVLLLNPNLYMPGIQCYALFVCMVAGMFGLMGAYAAGSSLHLRTSIFVLTMVAALVILGLVAAIVRAMQKEDGREVVKKQDDIQQVQHENTQGSQRHAHQDQEADKAMYLMVVGILAASVTYLTGLKPPGGLWRDNGNGHTAGNPVLYDIDKRRYNAFFYSNSTSFMASVIVIALLLQRMLRPGHGSQTPLWAPMHTTMVLNMLALLGAYAAGSAREWFTSGMVILLLFPILLIIVILFYFFRDPEDRKPNTVMIDYVERI